MQLLVPDGVIVLEATERSAAIIRRMMDTNWWERANAEGVPLINSVWANNRPTAFLFDLRSVGEKSEAHLLTQCPTATKMGNTPDNLLFMSGNKYRLTSLDWDRPTDNSSGGTNSS